MTYVLLLMIFAFFAPIISISDFHCNIRRGKCISTAKSACNGKLWKGYCAKTNEECCIVSSREEDDKCIRIAGHCDVFGSRCKRGVLKSGLCSKGRNCCVLKDWMYMSRRDWDRECEAAVNKQINMELTASYIYTSMACHFERRNPAYKKMCEHFQYRAREEYEHAEMLMSYQNERGGKVVLDAIKKPPRSKWGHVLRALRTVMKLEKSVDVALHDLYDLAGSKGDTRLQDFIKTIYFPEQEHDMAGLKVQIAKLKTLKNIVDVYLYVDKMFSKSH